MEQPSILDYLAKKGVELRPEGNKYFCSSLFSRDSNWSLCIYPKTNSFFDWSNGFGGSVWHLMSKVEGRSIKELKQQHFEYEKFKPYSKQYKEKEKSKTTFDYTRYINTNTEECKKIKEYADSRCLEEGSYFCGVFFTRKGSEQSGIQNLSGDVELRQSKLWVRNPAIAFLHVDKDLKPCGIKFRRLDDNNPRFSARGKLGLYLLNGLEGNLVSQVTSTVLYVVEGEANANSLFYWKKQRNESCVIISKGAVSTALSFTDLPQKLIPLPKKVIIDFDGNEELYQERLKLYEHLKAEAIKLILPKGEDINSLHMKNKLYLIENLL